MEKVYFFSTHITSDLDKIADMLIMIDSGQIVFQEEKDQLLDSYRIIKGSAEKLNSDTRKIVSLHRRSSHLILRELQNRLLLLWNVCRMFL